MTTQTAQPKKQTLKNLKGAAAKGAGPGRPKGVPNKTTTALKEMILQALDGAGGLDYLIARAHDPKTSGAFLTLVGKVLPMQVTGADGGAVIHRVEFSVVDPAG